MIMIILIMIIVIILIIIIIKYGNFINKILLYMITD